MFNDMERFNNALESMRQNAEKNDTRKAAEKQKVDSEKAAAEKRHNDFVASQKAEWDKTREKEQKEQEQKEKEFRYKISPEGKAEADKRIEETKKRALARLNSPEGKAKEAEINKQKLEAGNAAKRAWKADYDIKSAERDTRILAGEVTGLSGQDLTDYISNPALFEDGPDGQLKRKVTKKVIMPQPEKVDQSKLTFSDTPTAEPSKEIHNTLDRQSSDPFIAADAKQKMSHEASEYDMDLAERFNKAVANLEGARLSRDTAVKVNRGVRAQSRADLRNAKKGRGEDGLMTSDTASPAVSFMLSTLFKNSVMNDSVKGDNSDKGIHLLKEYSHYADNKPVKHLTQEMVGKHYLDNEDNDIITQADLDNYNQWVEDYSIPWVQKKGKEYFFEDGSKATEEDYKNYKEGYSVKEESYGRKFNSNITKDLRTIAIKDALRQLGDNGFTEDDQALMDRYIKDKHIREIIDSNETLDYTDREQMLSEIVDETVHNGIIDTGNAADTQNRQIFADIYNSEFQKVMHQFEEAALKASAKSAREDWSAINKEKKARDDAYWKDILSNAKKFDDAKTYTSNVANGQGFKWLITHNGNAIMGRIGERKGQKVLEFYTANKQPESVQQELKEKFKGDDFKVAQYSPNTEANAVLILPLPEDADYNDIKHLVNQAGWNLESRIGKINDRYSERYGRVQKAKTEEFHDRTLEMFGNKEGGFGEWMTEGGRNIKNTVSVKNALKELDGAGLAVDINSGAIEDKASLDERDNMYSIMQKMQAAKLQSWLEHLPALKVYKPDDPSAKSNISKGGRTRGKYNKGGYGAGSVDWSDIAKTAAAERAQMKGYTEGTDTQQNVIKTLTDLLL